MTEMRPGWANEQGGAVSPLWFGNRADSAAGGGTFDRVNPFDGSVVATFSNADAGDAERAILFARKTFDAGIWPRSTARSRYEILARAAELIAARAEDFARSMVRESGKPLRLARGETKGAVKTIQYYAGLVLDLEGSAIADRVADAFGLVLHEPVGVAGLITPWNFPLLNPVSKVAPAIAAGCTAILKPSHLCPGPAVLLAEVLAEAGLPDGVLSVLTSDIDRGAMVGQALAASPLVDKIAFTGSTAVGRAVMASAASNNKKVALELGGKSANIVFDDAPAEAAAATAINGFCFNSGQQCSAGSRLLVHDRIYDEFLDRVVAQARLQVLGDPMDEATTMGPLINPDQYARVTGYIALGREEGRLVAGGGRPAALDHDGSLFVEPTIFDQLGNDSRLAREEIFGPVLSVIRFSDAEEAIRLANASDYGLAGAVWTRSLDRAMGVVRAVRTGKMFVNSYNTAGIDDMPHGGYKASGIGREFGREGLKEFQQVKTVQMKLSLEL